MIDILITFTDNQPLRMIAWIGVFYAFIGLGNQKWDFKDEINYVGIFQVILLIIISYINFNIELDSINQGLQNLK